MDDWQADVGPEVLRISLKDLERLVKAAGLRFNSFLARLRSINPKLAETIEKTRQWLSITRAGDYLDLRTLLKVSPYQARMLHKSEPFDMPEGIFELLRPFQTQLGLRVLAALKTQERWPSLLGAMLKEWREEMKVTQAQVAKKARLGQNDVSRIERGRYKAKGPRTWRSWQAKVQRIVQVLDRFEGQGRQRKT